MESQPNAKRCSRCGAEMELFPIGRTMIYKCPNCGNEESMATL